MPIKIHINGEVGTGSGTQKEGREEHLSVTVTSGKVTIKSQNISRSSFLQENDSAHAPGNESLSVKGESKVQSDSCTFRQQRSSSTNRR